jgi:hypothetical protein
MIAVGGTASEQNLYRTSINGSHDSHGIVWHN